jgi:hypothetical protein
VSASSQHDPRRSIVCYHPLVEKRLELGLVQVAEALLCHVADIAVFVSLLFCDSVNLGFVSADGVQWDGPVADAKLAKMVDIYGPSRIVLEALVPGKIVEIVGTHDCRRGRTFARSGGGAMNLRDSLAPFLPVGSVLHSDLTDSETDTSADALMAGAENNQCCSSSRQLG